MKRLFVVFIALSVVGISLYLLGYILPFKFISRDKVVNDSNCNDMKMARDENIKGVVVTKTRDSRNHMWKTVEYSNTTGIHQTLIFRNDESGAYEFLLQGDSILKDYNSLELIILRDTIVTKYQLNYGCIQ